jgi:hypothetical protein
MNDFINMEGIRNEDQVTPQYRGHSDIEKTTAMSIPTCKRKFMKTTNQTSQYRYYLQIGNKTSGSTYEMGWT